MAQRLTATLVVGLLCCGAAAAQPLPGTRARVALRAVAPTIPATRPAASPHHALQLPKPLHLGQAAPPSTFAPTPSQQPGGVNLKANPLPPSPAEALPNTVPPLIPSATGAGVAIDLRTAYGEAVRTNVNSLVAKERIREAEARIDQAWAALLPNLKFAASQYNRTVNLAAQGLAGGSTALPIPTFVGPFYTFDARLQAVYTFFNPEARWLVRSEEAGRLIRETQVKLTAQQVGTSAATAYVQLISAQDVQASIAADLEVARQTLQLARDQKAVGVAAGIDVTRAETQLTEQILRQQSADQQVAVANLNLARILGTPLGQVFQPRKNVIPSLGAAYDLNSAVALARVKRVELAVYEGQERQMLAQINAAEASTDPTLGVVADYGFNGNTPTQNIYGTHNVGVVLNFPFYDGGLADGRANEIRSQLEQTKAKHRDQLVQIEQDVRTAFLNLQLTVQQQAAAAAEVALAQKELIQSSDRFAAGLTNNLEVTQAQASLSRARQNLTQARVSYASAVLQLAVAIGNPEDLTEEVAPQ